MVKLFPQTAVPLLCPLQPLTQFLAEILTNFLAFCPQPSALREKQSQNQTPNFILKWKCDPEQRDEAPAKTGSLNPLWIGRSWAANKKKIQEDFFWWWEHRLGDLLAMGSQGTRISFLPWYYCSS